MITNIHTYTHTPYICLHTLVRPCIYMQMCVYIHKHIHTYVHQHLRARAPGMREALASSRTLGHPKRRKDLEVVYEQPKLFRPLQAHDAIAVRTAQRNLAVLQAGRAQRVLGRACVMYAGEVSVVLHRCRVGPHACMSCHAHPQPCTRTRTRSRASTKRRWCRRKLPSLASSALLVAARGSSA